MYVHMYVCTFVYMYVGGIQPMQRVDDIPVSILFIYHVHYVFRSCSMHVFDLGVCMRKFMYVCMYACILCMYVYMCDAG